MADETPPDAGGQGAGGAQPRSRDEISETVRRAAARKGGLETYCAELLDDNLEYRERLRQRDRQLAELQKPGSVVVAQADADELAQWRGLGLKPDAAKTQLAERTALETKVKGYEQQDLVRRAAALEGYGYAADVLADLLQSRGQVLALAEVEVKDGDGKTVKRPGATVRGADTPAADAIELGAYVEQHLAAFKPALLPATAAAPPAGRPAGTAWPRQHGAAPAGGGTTPAAEEKLEQAARATGDYAPL